MINVLNQNMNNSYDLISTWLYKWTMKVFHYDFQMAKLENTLDCRVDASKGSWKAVLHSLIVSILSKC